MTAAPPFVVQLGRRVPPWFALALTLALSAAWQLTLNAFDAQFRQLSGFPLLDLQNSLRPGEIITPTEVITQIRTYSQDTRTLYWVFFTLDTLAPPVVFSSYALLWASLLSCTGTRPARWLLHSPLLWLPLGVGLFDWCENLGYVSAIQAAEPGPQSAAVLFGLTFKWIKAACVIPTTVLTLPLLVYVVASGITRRRPERRSRSTKEEA